MLKDFKDIFSEFVFERISEVGSKITRNDLEYIKAREKQNSVLEHIQKVLPEEYGYLFFELESLLSSREAINIDIIYKQGFKDGIDFQQTFS